MGSKFAMLFLTVDALPRINFIILCTCDEKVTLQMLTS